MSFFCDKRAITPVLSNILLMVVAVAAMAIATTSTYIITLNLRENMSERIVVEDLWFNREAGRIQVYLRNTGKVSVRISAVYVNHVSQPFVFPPILEINGHGWLNITYGWVSSETYHIDIVTSRGNHIAGYYKAP